MQIRYTKGDATKPQKIGNKIIVHICNDIGGWGKGFVVAISKRWPLPEKEYRAWHKSGDNLFPIRCRKKSIILGYYQPSTRYVTGVQSDI